MYRYTAMYIPRLIELNKTSKTDYPHSSTFLSKKKMACEKEA